jgi:PAS domain S-box-containing protein
MQRQPEGGRDAALARMRRRAAELESELVACRRALASLRARRKHDAEHMDRATAQLQSLAAQVAQSRDLLRVVFDGMPDGLLLLDGSGTVRLANEQLGALVAMSPAAVVGQSWRELCAQGRLPFECGWVLETLRSGHAETRRVRYSDQGGRPFVLDITTLPLPHYTSDPQLIVRFTDCTERLQLETIAIQSERFIASGTLAAMVAHEVNTPLQAINNFLFLLEHASPDERARFLALARDELGRVGRILQQLLDLYRPLSAQQGPIDLNALAERVLLLTRGTCERQGIHVATRLDPQVPPVWGRADHLMQLALNLVMNAIEAMPSGGQLTVSTTDRIGTAGDSVEMRVSDTGHGIPPELRERVFEPFVTTKASGTGLGLPICRSIAQQHAGNVFLEPNAGAGVSFVVHLPRASSHESQKS